MSLLLILIPILSSLAVFALRGNNVRFIALAAAVANLAVTAAAWAGFDPNAVTNHAFSAAWVPQAGISFSLGMDGISLLLIVLTNLLAPLIVLTSFNRSFGNDARYYGLVLLMLGGFMISAALAHS
ncbi:MAG TPA: hypothetical protein PKH43_07400, partial [Saprospiraceae bacterium]|nr:hypothetical protein [Saprospiraceae bacterium]